MSVDFDLMGATWNKSSPLKFLLIGRVVQVLNENDPISIALHFISCLVSGYKFNKLNPNRCSYLTDCNFLTRMLFADSYW